MAESLSLLLEQKRHKLKEDRGAFAKRLKMHRTMYSKIINGDRRLPRKFVDHVSKLLGMKGEDLTKIVHSEKIGLERGRVLDARDLSYLLKIVKAADTPLPLSSLLHFLDIKKTNQA